MILRLPNPVAAYRNWRCSRDWCSDRDVVLVPPSGHRADLSYYRCMRCGRAYLAASATNFTRSVITQRRLERAVESAEQQRIFDEHMRALAARLGES